MSSENFQVGNEIEVVYFSKSKGFCQTLSGIVEDVKQTKDGDEQVIVKTDEYRADGRPYSSFKVSSVQQIKLNRQV